MDTLKAEIVIPDWVNWIAVDEDGKVFGFEAEPEAIGNCWTNTDLLMERGFLYVAKPPKDWTTELYKWE